MTYVKITLPRVAHNYAKANWHIRNKLAEQFGGFTAFKAQGGWVNDDGELIEEPVMVYESYTTKSVPMVKGTMHLLASHVRNFTEEDCVMYVINHDVSFVYED